VERLKQITHHLRQPSKEGNTTMSEKCGQQDDSGYICGKAPGHFGCHRGGPSVWLREDSDTCAPLDDEATAQFVRDHMAPTSSSVVAEHDVISVWILGDGFGGGQTPDQAREQDLDFSHIRDSSPEAYEKMAVRLDEMGYPKFNGCLSEGQRDASVTAAQAAISMAGLIATHPNHDPEYIASLKMMRNRINEVITIEEARS
jgi:hypothetical protein